jgi:hypothetical protein
VTVRLLNSSGTVLATTTTDINGVYRFANIAVSTYSIVIDATTLADDIQATIDNDGISTANSATVTLQSTQTTLTMNFGYMRHNPPGTGTRGYWVNHPAAWPVNSLYLGGVFYTKNDAIAVLQRATKGDMTYAMAAQLIATKLNLAGGNQSSCITSTVVNADAWMAQHPVGSNVKGNSSAWNVGEPLHNTLDDYNNGRLCAQHID